MEVEGPEGGGVAEHCGRGMCLVDLYGQLSCRRMSNRYAHHHILFHTHKAVLDLLLSLDGQQVSTICGIYLSSCKRWAAVRASPPPFIRRDSSSVFLAAYCTKPCLSAYHAHTSLSSFRAGWTKMWLRALLRTKATL